MTHLHEHRYLKCPYTRAKGYIRLAFDEAAKAHTPRTISLQVPFAGGDATGALHKDVIATYAEGTDPMHFDQPWKIHWTPAEGGPYPDFDGELTVRADEDYPTSILELTGSYRPPLGVPGAIFDAVLGKRIAEATARELLRTIGENMEARYRAEEAAKIKI